MITLIYTSTIISLKKQKNPTTKTHTHTNNSDCLKTKSDFLHISFNFACLCYRVCISSIYVPSWQAITKRVLQAVCLSVFSQIHSEGKKTLHLRLLCLSSYRSPKWYLHMLFQMTEPISVTVLLNNSLVSNTNIPHPSASLQY